MPDHIRWHTRRGRPLERNTCHAATVGEIVFIYRAYHLRSISRKLVVPGDLRSYGGGNGLPRAVRQSPNFSRIAEEDEGEEAEKTMHVTTLRVRFD